MLFPTLAFILRMHLFFSGSFAIFFWPSQSWYDTDYFYSIPEVLCLQEFNKFTFSQWLNKTLGGEHLVATSIQIKSCKEKHSQMHPTATYYCLTGDRRDLQHNHLNTSICTLENDQVLAAKNLRLVELAFVMQNHTESSFRRYQAA